jgi:DNA-binding transcriptional MerR regulator
MDDLPEVKAIFDRNRATFVSTINKLVNDISADNKRVIQECKDELANARQTIKEYVDKLGPDLKDIGRKAAEEMDAKLDELDKFVAKKEQELQDKLKDKQQAAIKAIDEKIEKMKEAISGALSKLGKLLLLAAKKFFTWALEKVGFSLADIESIINKGAAVLKAIFTKPIQFVKNLIKAAVTGFKNFRDNFITHLKDAVFEWLSGALEGVKLPETWDLKGIMSVVLQMLGLTWANIRSKMVDLLGETVVKGLENTFTLVKTLVTEGPMAAWEQLKELGGEIKPAFAEAVSDYIKIEIVKKAVETILGMFIPGAGIIRAIVGIYDTVVFFIKRAKDIMQMIGNFLGSIAEIAAGNTSAAADALEKGLARGLLLVIDFLARFLRLSGITKKIQGAIQKIRGKVDAVSLKVANWIARAAKKAGRFVIQAGVPQDPNERLTLAVKAASAAASRLRGRITQSLLNPILKAIQARYGLQQLQAFEQGRHWWVKAAINPSLSQDLGVFVNPEDAAKTQGVLDLYRGIFYADKAVYLDELDLQVLAEQLVREEDFSPAVYTILSITRIQATGATLTDLQRAAQTVITEVRHARTIANVKPWWNATRRPNLFFAMLQRFINRRSVFQEELKERRIKQMSGFTFTDIPFISTTKNPVRAAQYAKGVVKATTKLPQADLPGTNGKVVGKVFIYLFDGNDLVQLQAADIRSLASQGAIAPHVRYSKADSEVAFTGSIPSENRVGDILVKDEDSVASIAAKARRIAGSRASSRGGLILVFS